MKRFVSMRTGANKKERSDIQVVSTLPPKGITAGNPSSSIEYQSNHAFAEASAGRQNQNLEFVMDSRFFSDHSKESFFSIRKVGIK